jgi:hypothetical protein
MEWMSKGLLKGLQPNAQACSHFWLKTLHPCDLRACFVTMATFNVYALSEGRTAVRVRHETRFEDVAPKVTTYKQTWKHAEAIREKNDVVCYSVPTRDADEFLNAWHSGVDFDHSKYSAIGLDAALQGFKQAVESNRATSEGGDSGRSRKYPSLSLREIIWTSTSFTGDQQWALRDFCGMVHLTLTGATYSTREKVKLCCDSYTTPAQDAAVDAIIPYLRVGLALTDGMHTEMQPTLTLDLVLNMCVSPALRITSDDAVRDLRQPYFRVSLSYGVTPEYDALEEIVNRVLGRTPQIVIHGGELLAASDDLYIDRWHLALPICVGLLAQTLSQVLEERHSAKTIYIAGDSTFEYMWNPRYPHHGLDSERSAPLGAEHFEEARRLLSEAGFPSIFDEYERLVNLCPSLHHAWRHSAVRSHIIESLLYAAGPKFRALRIFMFAISGCPLAGTYEAIDSQLAVMASMPTPDARVICGGWNSSLEDIPGHAATLASLIVDGQFSCYNIGKGYNALNRPRFLKAKRHDGAAISQGAVSLTMPGRG